MISAGLLQPWRPGVQAAVNGMQEEMKSDADEQDAADARVQDAQPGTDMGVAAAHENEGLVSTEGCVCRR